PAWVRPGTLRDAILYAVGCNLKHGLIANSKDREKAARVLLEDPEWKDWSDREICRRSGAHHAVVVRIRRELDGSRDGGASATSAQIEGRRCQRNGTTYTMKPRTAAPSVSAAAVSAEAERHRDRWLREALEGLEHARKNFVPLAKHWRDKFLPIK